MFSIHKMLETKTKKKDVREKDKDKDVRDKDKEDKGVRDKDICGVCDIAIKVTPVECYFKRK